MKQWSLDKDQERLQQPASLEDRITKIFEEAERAAGIKAKAETAPKPSPAAPEGSIWERLQQERQEAKRRERELVDQQPEEPNPETTEPVASTPRSPSPGGFLMQLNRNQKAVLVTTALLIASSTLYPPWHSRGTEFHFLFDPPGGPLAFTVLLAEWFAIVVAGAVAFLLLAGGEAVPAVPATSRSRRRTLNGKQIAILFITSLLLTAGVCLYPVIILREQRTALYNKCKDLEMRNDQLQTRNKWLEARDQEMEQRERESQAGMTALNQKNTYLRQQLESLSEAERLPDSSIGERK